MQIHSNSVHLRWRFFGPVVIGSVCLISLILLPGVRAELLVGATQTDITPPLPVALSGQFHTRIATIVESPLIAAAVALEKRDTKGNSIDQAVMVSCDLVIIPDDVLEQVRENLRKRNLEGLRPRKVFLSATHTHTAPVMMEGNYDIPGEGVTTPAEFVEFLVTKVSDLVEEAWTGREAGEVAWGMGNAVVAQNRRITYLDGTAKMYGATGNARFKGIEGAADHGVEVLFIRSGNDKQPSAIAVNVACPAQEVGNRSAVNADYWHEVRQSLAEKFGDDVVILAWIGAAGDQSPRLMMRRAAEQRMLEARGLTRLEEISRRIVAAVDEAWLAAKRDFHPDPPLKHRVLDLELPRRLVTPEELAEAKTEIEKIRTGPGEELHRNLARWAWNQQTIDRFEKQEGDPVLPMEMHVLRIGEVAICTNRFELYTEYGLRMKARSRALQTFVIQLAGQGSYLATEEAENAGGYSAIVNSCEVGPRGGGVLVDEAVNAINAMWEENP
ncbi:MAG: hypothetical protein P1U68_16630 [Verrucomicrobiales bacterium]|nr:hypothetical protein [Verrucomicrobiales bacterium]